MDFQTAFNLVAGGVAFLGGWVLKTVWEAIEDLQKEEKALTDKVATIQVLVAGKYVPRDELSKQFDQINDALRRIEDKLDSKADK